MLPQIQLECTMDSDCREKGWCRIWILPQSTSNTGLWNGYANSERLTISQISCSLSFTLSHCMMCLQHVRENLFQTAKSPKVTSRCCLLGPLNTVRHCALPIHSAPTSLITGSVCCFSSQTPLSLPLPHVANGPGLSNNILQ